MKFQLLKKYFSQEPNKTKSIYKHITQPTKVTKYEILKYGYPESRCNQINISYKLICRFKTTSRFRNN